MPNLVHQLAAERANQTLRDFASFSAIANQVPQPSNEYSVLRALNALIRDWGSPSKVAPLEAAQSEEIAKRVGRSPQPGCLFVPVETRDLSIASSGGGYLAVKETAPGGIFASALRDASASAALGVQQVDVVGNTAAFPVNVSDALTYWVASETSQITESEPTFNEVPVGPKTVGAYVEIGRLLLRQMAADASAFLMRELAKPVAAKFDNAIIDGAGGTDVPRGILRTSNIGTGSGATLTWDKVVDAILAVESAKGMVNPAAAGWALSPDTAAIMRKRVKETGGGQFILENGMIDGRKAFVSSSVPAGTALFGDWSQVVTASFGILEIGIVTADTGSELFRAGKAAIRALWSVDTAVLHPTSFYSLTSCS